jgi:exopolyphosphatase / guanosine-5'-triphosphate,3'-diphosphate pyrophosphatase
MEVLSGEDEARISFLGATHGLTDDPRGAEATPPWLVLDIGGGSTEAILGSSPDAPEQAVSTNIGSVRLTERFVRGDPPSPEDLDAVHEEVVRHLERLEQSVDVGRAASMIGVAGTPTTIQAIAFALHEYDPDLLHRTWLSLADAERVAGLLNDMTTEERRVIPTMAPGREDVIPAGAAILVEAMRRWGFDRALVSETDILDGLLLRLVREAAPR